MRAIHQVRRRCAHNADHLAHDTPLSAFATEVVCTVGGAAPRRDLTALNRDLTALNRGLTALNRDLTALRRDLTAPRRALTDSKRGELCYMRTYA